MRRRQALRMLPALCLHGLGTPGPARAAPGPERPAASAGVGLGVGVAAPLEVLVWGSEGAWIVGAAGTQALPAGLPPVAVAGALWTADGDGGLRRWQAPAAGADGAPRWHVAAAPRLGAPPHALAASADGRHAIVAHGERLTLLDADARVLRRYEGRDLARSRRGVAETLWAHAGRRSFVAAWPALGEWWEIPLDPDAPPIYDGLVHDYRMDEALPSPGHLGVRRVPLGRPLPPLEFADPRVPWLAGRADDGVAIVHLDVRRRIATLPLPAARPAAAALVATPAGWRWWLPDGDRVPVVDASRWTVDDRWPAPPGLTGLRSVGPSVWAFGAAGLQRWHDGAWRALAGAAGPVTALQAGRGPHGGWIVAGTPAVLLHLDADGELRARLPLPEGARITGLTAL
jgi:hypothetical protein